VKLFSSKERFALGKLMLLYKNKGKDVKVSVLKLLLGAVFLDCLDLEQISILFKNFKPQRYVTVSPVKKREQKEINKNTIKSVGKS